MRSNEFVKKFGLKITKKILRNAPDWAYETAGIKDYANKEWSESYPMDAYVKVDDLKRLVESHELVEKFGGLFQAKVILDKEGFTGGIELNDDLISDDELKQAIADVESCM